MARIVLLGCAGTGKTTFARRYRARTGAALIHLDAIDRELKRQGRIDSFRDTMISAHAGEAWISDGNFALGTFDIRLPHATTIVWLEAPRWLCLLRALRRPLQSASDHRFAAIRDVISYIWTFDKKARPRIEAAIRTHGPNLPLTRLRSAREVEAYFAAL